MQGTIWTNNDWQLINLITPHRCTQSVQHCVLSFWVYISKHWNKTRNTLSRLITKSPQHASRASHSLLGRCLYTLEDTHAIHVTPHKVTLCHSIQNIQTRVTGLLLQEHIHTQTRMLALLRHERICTQAHQQILCQQTLTTNYVNYVCGNKWYFNK